MTRELRDRIASFFQTAAHGVVAVYVFGSTARGEAGPESDVDVAVLLDRPLSNTLTGGRLTLEGDLERHIGRTVDLVVLNSASADLVHRVLEDGVVVVDGVPGRRIRFEVAKRNEFFDLEPIRRLYRRSAERQRPGAS